MGSRELATRPRYLKFLLDARRQNRVFALTLPRIMLAYRTVPHLDADDRALLREREEQQTEALARYLVDRAGLAAGDNQARVIANMIVLINAYGPLRDWVYRDIEQEEALDTVVEAVMAMVGTLGRKP